MSLRTAVVQHDIRWQDPTATCSDLAPRVAAAAAAGARLVVLSEMFACGFSMNTEVTAEPVGGPTATWLCERAMEHGVWLAGSVPTRLADLERPVNRLHLVAPDGSLTTYDKIHTFTYAGESDHFAAGSQPVVANVEGVRLGLTVCFDLRFADLYWDMADRVDAYLVVANWPQARREHWRALLRARAIENQAWVVACNRVGTDGNDLGYAGDSAVIDPLGEVVASASGDPVMLLTDVDPSRTADVRRRLPFQGDRRQGQSATR